MNRFFGNSKATPKPNLSDAIASTDTRIGTIEVKVRKLDAELTRYRDQMAKMREGPGKGAIQKRAIGVLKQKRMYEGQLQQLQQQTFNMEQASMTTDNLRNTMATVDAMQRANKEMKKQYKNINIDKIESIHYDMEDLIDQANEIQESLGRSYGVPDEIDESDLQAELDALADEGYAEEESEGALPSYLQNTNTLPDFVDADPVPESATPAQAEVAR
ncbi:charged multivesicular body protein 5 [Phaffia rhodozyma]|uniref:Charged multivesicular body protein 5 n=1 Tax=Phaffia rhodozyma TaxID=264483 RepID=A0A0F7SE80_PHARH|nr:charged multivesicular body protein 5 [Phaffia rhodozyma]